MHHTTRVFRMRKRPRCVRKHVWTVIPFRGSQPQRKATSDGNRAASIATLDQGEKSVVTLRHYPY